MVENGCQFYKFNSKYYSDYVHDNLSSFLILQLTRWTPTQNNIPRIVLVITRTKSTTPSPIITRKDVASKANTQSVHHIIHMTHALPFGIPCSETMSVHARLVKATLISACAKLSCTRCMHLLILSHPIITRCFETTSLGNGATKDEHFIILKF